MSPCFRHLVPLAVVAAIVSGCSTTWSADQKAKLAHIAIEPATTAPDAYHVPSAKDSPGMGRSIPQATGGGLIPALIGEAIDAGVTAHQQSKFEQTAAVHFEALKQAAGAAPAMELDHAVRAALSAHPFFGPRLSDNGSAKLTLRILSYGLNKSPSSQKDDILLRLSFEAEAKLAAGDDELFHGKFTGNASRAARPAEILKDPAFFTTSREEAVRDFASQLVGSLDVKTRDKK